MSTPNKLWKPPVFAAKLLKFILPDGRWNTPLGDFEEFFNLLANEKGIRRARLWYWGQILRLIPIKLINSLMESLQMFNNYLKVAFRSIRRHKGYSLINILGLAIGLACSLMILAWIRDEISFDRFHKNKDTLYIVATHEHQGNRTAIHSGTPSALGPALKTEYPEIVNTARICNGPHTLNLSYGDKRFQEEVEAVDPSFLEMFSFRLVEGDAATALPNPHSLVLTEKMAFKYFGTTDVLGKTIKVDNKYDFLVTGVLENLLANSSFQFDFLFPITFFEKYWSFPELLNRWHDFSFTTYVQLEKSAVPSKINREIAGRIHQGNTSFTGESSLQLFTRLHLYGLESGEGRINAVRMISLIGVFILLIACINFMNLTTARSGNRAKEIRIRKVIGANQSDIVKQFYAESFLMIFISFLLALLLVALALPLYNDVTGKAATISVFSQPVLLWVALAVVFLSGLISGTYPAVFMSSFQPVKVLKKTRSWDSNSSFFRKALVVLQFAISIILIIRTIIAFKQVDYMQHKDLGFNRDLLVYTPVSGALQQQYSAAKQELLQLPGISHVSLTSRTPLGFYSSGNDWNWEGKNPNINPSIRFFCCDHDFVKTFKITLVQGKFFSLELASTDSVTAGQLVINEEMARLIGKDNPVGMRLSQDSNHFSVIGVVNDFNYWPLHHRSGPLIIFYKTFLDSGNARYRYIFARLEPGNIPQTISEIEEIIKKFNPEFPFSLHFLDEDYDQLYRTEQRSGAVFRSFALMAILISCLGLFGLASYMTEQRTKEIGIRKVLGASVGGVMLMIAREFIKWVAAANLIAWPIAWYVSHNWLQNFAYRSHIGLEVFLVTALLSLIISLISVVYQSLKSASANPIDSLRYE